MSDTPLEPFILLADPDHYRACEWDFTTDSEARHYWVPLLLRNFEVTLQIAAEADLSEGRDADDTEQRISACRAALHGRMQAYLNDPSRYGRVTILTLDRWRTEILRSFGFFDPYRLFKRRENERVLPLLRPWCDRLDAMNPDARALAVVEGVLAGNIFDMGAEATARQFAQAPPDFEQVRRKLPPRPWLLDDFESLAPRLTRHFSGGGVFRKLVFFIDNAGSDFVLGAVPLARAMALGGCEVVLVANASPTLNDMTLAEVESLWPELCRRLPDLAGLPMTRVSSGTGEPVIDLSAVSAELNAASAGADLVLLEGMGRGVESNLHARMRCDRLNLAMIKDPFVAARHGGKLYDCVCVYRPLSGGVAAGVSD